MKSLDELIIEHENYIKKIAYGFYYKFKNLGILDIEDILQAGYYGLCEAYRKFDETKGYKFLTYAGHYIKKEIMREVYNYCNTVRIPVYIWDKKEAVENMVSVTSENKEIGEELLLKDSEPFSEEDVNFELAWVKDIVRKTPPIIKDRFFGGKTLLEIGKENNYSKERIRQLQNEEIGDLNYMFALDVVEASRYSKYLYA